MLYFVGVGPGDPELITMKAARILREADAVALPDSGKDSVVWKIASEWIKDKPVCRLAMPMKGKRDEWEKAHDLAAHTLLDWLEKYESVAYPVLGDPGIYASASYLMKRIAPIHPCSVIAGVPAMCAAAAALEIPLCEQGERLIVTDSCANFDDCTDGNCIIMKAGKNLRAISEAARGREAFIAGNIGMENQFVGKLEENTQIPSYFTTVILK